MTTTISSLIIKREEVIKMKNCDICPFVAEQTIDDPAVVLQTDRWNAVLDRNQIYLGKGFVTLREHKSSLSELDETDWRELHEVIRSMEHAITQAFGADVCNWECLMNNAVKAGQSTHVHWHLYPRYVGGTHFAGEDFPDPKWPRHLESGEHHVSEELFGKIVFAVREHLP